MSANKVSSDGFRVVRQRRKGKSKNNKQISPFVTGGVFEDCLIDTGTALRLDEVHISLIIFRL